jgi:RNA polymerase sigma factor
MTIYKESLKDRATKIRNDSDRINSFISEFRPFIASVAQKRTGRFLRYGSDEELSIGMMAFKEAIDSYDGTKGNFLSFAKLIINMRLIDYFRKEGRARNISLDGEGSESVREAVDKKSMEQYRIDNENEERILKIIEYRKELKKWGITLKQLVRVSPKKDSLRNHYIKVAKVIVDNRKLLDILLKTKRLPIKEIEKVTFIHRKKLERGRIYIIAMVVALLQNFSYLDVCRGDREQ